jgi:adenylate cyclase
MESRGLPDAIQVSAPTWERLRDRYDFAPRGPLEVKRIGVVEAFLLTGRRVPSPPG